MRGRVGFAGWFVGLTLVVCSSFICGQTTPRNFRMGFYDAEPATRNQAFDYVHAYIKNNADLFMEHVYGDNLPWCDFLPGAAVSAATASRYEIFRNKRNFLGLNDHKYYVYISMISPNFGVADGACKPANDFANPQVRSAFVRYVQYLVQVLNPDYLTIGVEANIYTVLNPTDFPNLVSLYKEAYRAAKALKPTMLVFPSLSLFLFYNGAEWDLMRAFEPEIDAVGFTFYGDDRVLTQNLPADYVSKAYEYTSRPLAISEMGFNSQTVTLTDGTIYRGSDAEQIAFVQRMMSEAEKLDMLFTVWYILADISQFISTAPASLQNIYRRYQYCGIRQWPSRAAKPAETYWDAPWARPLQEERPATAFPYSILASGLRAFKSLGGGAETQTGSFMLAANAGSSIPSGYAVLSLRRNGVVVTEASIPPATLTTRWLGLIETSIGARMGAAITNPTNQSARLVLDVLTPDAATVLSTTTVTLAANGQIVKYVDELALLLPSDFQGLLRISSDQPVAAVSLKTSLTSRGDPIIAVAPPADLNGQPTMQPLYFPYIVDGGGYATELVLINPTSQMLSGSVNFAAGPGIPIELTIGPRTDIGFPYQLPPYGVATMKTAGTGDLRIVYAGITPDGGQPAPTASALFSLTQNGILLSEVGAAAVPPLSRAHVYVDFNIQTTTIVISMVNPNDSPAQVSMYLVGKDGTRVGTDMPSFQIPPHGHSVQSVLSLIPSIPYFFQGMLHIESDRPISVFNTREALNERGEILMSGHPPVDWSMPSTSSMLVFPGAINGNGYRTQVILMDPAATGMSGLVSFFTPSGELRRLRMRE